MIAPSSSQPPLRSGKWTPEEEEFANALIDEFKAGTLPALPEGTSMRGFLAKMLRCVPKRVSKKFENTNYNGKQQYIRDKSLSPHEMVQRRLKLDRLERSFLQSISTPEYQYLPQSALAAMSGGWGSQHHHHPSAGSITASSLLHQATQSFGPASASAIASSAKKRSRSSQKWGESLAADSRTNAEVEATRIMSTPNAGGADWDTTTTAAASARTPWPFLPSALAASTNDGTSSSAAVASIGGGTGIMGSSNLGGAQRLLDPAATASAAAGLLSSVHGSSSSMLAASGGNTTTGAAGGAGFGMLPQDSLRSASLLGFNSNSASAAGLGRRASGGVGGLSTNSFLQQVPGERLGASAMSSLGSFGSAQQQQQQEAALLQKQLQLQEQEKILQQKQIQAEEEARLMQLQMHLERQQLRQERSIMEAAAAGGGTTTGFLPRANFQVGGGGLHHHQVDPSATTNTSINDASPRTQALLRRRVSGLPISAASGQQQTHLSGLGHDLDTTVTSSRLSLLPPPALAGRNTSNIMADDTNAMMLEFRQQLLGRRRRELITFPGDAKQCDDDDDEDDIRYRSGVGKSSKRRIS